MNSVTSPKVSVVIPNYNHARFLRRRINSILSQDFQDFEIVLLDDASTDGSVQIIEEYACEPRVTIEVNEKNSGNTFKQWNKGISMSRGEYVLIAESDDYAAAGLLERLVATLDAHPEVVFAYCRSWRVSDEDQLDGFQDRFFPEPQRWVSDHLINGRDMCRGIFMTWNIVPNASAVLFRKEAYRRCGGADETLKMGGDWKAWFALALQGMVAYVSEPLNFYRFHGNSVCGKDTLRVVEAEETLRIVQWMQEQVHSDLSMREQVGTILAGRWINPLLDTNVSFGDKWAILRCAIAVDPRAVRRLVAAIYRNWLWHPTLLRTRRFRQMFGLRQAKPDLSSRK